MPAIKPMAAIAEKYVRVTPQRQQDYEAGIRGTPPDKWSTNTVAAQGSWSAGVQAAAASGRFAAGIDGKGAKWQRKALATGVARFGPGVTAARDDYSAGFQKYHDVIASVQLDPRGPRGDPRNYNRSQALGNALHTARVGGGR